MPIVTTPLVARIPHRRFRRVGVLLFLAAGLTQCTSGTEPGGDPPGEAGFVTYRLVSPNGMEGAALVSVPAAAVVAVPAGSFLTTVITRHVGDLVYVAAIHRFGIEGLSFQLEVTDSDAPPALTLLEVVGPDDVQRALAGYAIEVVP